MRISVITVVFNNASTLAQAIASVAAQDYTALEYIIIDGGSSDGTLQVIEENKTHIDHYISEPDRGIYDAMNKGIGMATGAVIGILNSDDMYADARVISEVMALFEDPDTDAVYGDLVYVSQHNEQVVRYWQSGPFSPQAFRWGWMPPHPAFFVRKSLYEQYGRFRLDMKVAADYEFMLRLIEKHRIRLRYLPRVLVRMRTGGLSDGSLKQRLQVMRQDRLAWAVNGLRPWLFTIWLKVLRKIPQYFRKPAS